jgi:tetratricopeptide (TPR) repeat protein
VQGWLEKAVDVGDFDEAIRRCTEAIRFRPDYAPAYFNRYRARALSRLIGGVLADYNGEIADLTETIRLEPDHVHAYYWRGVARTSERDFVLRHKNLASTEATIADFQKYLDLGGPAHKQAEVERRIRDLTERLVRSHLG